MKQLELVRESLKRKHEQLNALRKLAAWRVADANVDPADAPAQAAAWTETGLSYTWTPNDAAKTFYHRLELPRMLSGISLEGVEVTLELVLIIGARVYVNGELRYSVDYWADTQLVPVVLTSSFEGQAFDIVVQCKQGDGFGIFGKAEIAIEQLDEWIFQLDTLAEELRFARFLLERDEVHAAAGLQALEQAVALYNPEVVEAHQWEAAGAMFEAMRLALVPFEEAAKRYKVHLIGHAHIDMNWLWPMEETVDLIKRDFESMLGIMDEYPEVCFSHSQAATYQIVQQQYPKLWERLKARVAQGRWDVTASTWVEGDLNMAGHETLVRQLLTGTTYVREQLGVDPQICWEPDTFGHPATMPQVLAQAGIRYYYHVRAGKGHPVYWWQGHDGSRVLVFNDPQGYTGRISASALTEGSVRMADRYGVATNMFVYGIGDHGGGITRQDVKRAIRLSASNSLPTIVFSGTRQFYQELEASGAAFPVVYGELNPVFEGCYSSHGDIKRVNRKTEHALLAAETTQGIVFAAELQQGAFAGKAADAVQHLQHSQHPQVAAHLSPEQLRAAWQRHCFNQFHDILCGCSIHDTYVEAVPAAERLIAQAEEAAASYRSRLANDRPPAYVTVFNDLSWERTDRVWLEGTAAAGRVHWQTGDTLVDAHGQAATLQRVGDDLVFVASGVPALGYRTYTYRQQAAAVAEQATASQDATGAAAYTPVHYSKSNPVLDNGRFELEIDAESGTLLSLLDKAVNRQLSYTPRGEWVEANETKGLLNLLEVHDEAPHPMSAWKLGTVTRVQRLVRGAQVEVISDGPVLQAVRVRHQVGASQIEQEIRLYRGLNRIEFPTKVQWRERGGGQKDGAMLRVAFTPKLAETKAAFEIPLGTVERTANGREMPAIHWIDVSETAAQPGGTHGAVSYAGGSYAGASPYGASLLNDAKYGHSVHGQTLGLTLLRSSYEPDNRGDEGDHAFTYAFYPHQGDWREAQAERQGYELNRPMSAVAGKNSQAPVFSTLAVEEWTGTQWVPATSLVVTALKLAEQQRAATDASTTTDASTAADASTEAPSLSQSSRVLQPLWVVRLKEMHQRAVRARIRFAGAIEHAEELNVLEDRIRALPAPDGSVLELGTLAAGDLRTFRFRWSSLNH